MNRPSLTYDEFRTLSFLTSQQLGGAFPDFNELVRIRRLTESEAQQHLSTLASHKLIAHDAETRKIGKVLIAHTELQFLLGDKTEIHEKFIAHLFDAGPHAEALHWLEESNDHTLGELPTNADSKQLAVDAYQAGATHVRAARIETYPGGANSGDLIIGVPGNTDRKNVFQWCGKMARKRGFEPDEDFGQKQLYVKLD